MTIETKYNIGDTVWLLTNNKAVSGEVKKIDLVVTFDSCHEVCAVALDKVHQFHVYDLNDLNACAEFEATLTDEELEAYREHLSELLNDTARIGLGFTAKPKMRCLAYLKTKGILP